MSLPIHDPRVVSARRNALALALTPLASRVSQNLIENIVRQRIYEQLYWKEECFALTPESLLEKAVELRCVGGTHGGQRQATKFLCLVLKLLQLQPDKEIVYEYIANEDFK